MVNFHHPSKEVSMPITLYTTTGCVTCRIARQFLKERY